MNFNDIQNPRELLSYMIENVIYAFVGKNNKIYDNPESDEWYDWYSECKVQTGEEILKTNVGICWDQVELERLWFKNHNYTYKTLFVYFESDTENSFPTHSFLLYKNKDKWYWFEHAFDVYEDIFEFDTFEDALRNVIDAFFHRALDTGAATNGDKNLIKCFEYDELTSSLSVDEYMNHVTSGKEISIKNILDI